MKSLFLFPYILFSAKFLKLEQMEQEMSFPTDTTGVSVEGTGQIGTYFYTAPEIEQGWPKIDEKVNAPMDSLVYFVCLFSQSSMHVASCSIFLFQDCSLIFECHVTLLIQKCIAQTFWMTQNCVCRLICTA